MSKKKKSRIPPSLILTDNNHHSWSGKIRGFLIDAKNWLLYASQLQMKRDGSSSPAVLARIRVVQHVLPCPVEIFCMETFHLLRFRLGEGSYAYKENFPFIDLVEFLSNANSQWHQTFDPRNQDVWIVIPKEKPFEMDFPFSMLEKAIDSISKEEQERLMGIRQQALNDIGFRPVELRIPSGDSDIRINAVARMVDGQITHLTPIDLVNDMKRNSKLLSICPDDVEQVMQRTRLLYINGFHEWEFFTMSVHYAVLALEASIRAIYDIWLGAVEVEVSAELQGNQIVKFMVGPRENILKWAKHQNVVNVTAKGALLPRNKSHLLDHLVKIGVLSDWEKERCAHLLWLRDVFSHPTGTFTEWVSWATQNISESCLWINLMWARFYKTIPYEFAWEKR